MGAITPKQQSFIKSLLMERASTLGLTEEGVDQYIVEQRLNELTSKSASFAINEIKKIKVKRAGADHLPADAERVIPNRYAKPCTLCGHEVAIGAGHAVLVGGSWDTYHKQGECSSDPVDKPVSAQSLYNEVEDGFYALQSTGKNDLVFYAIKTNKGYYNEALKGQRATYLIVGGHPDERLRGEREINAIKRIASLSPEERINAQALYGQQIGRCGVCGRTLTDEYTRSQGIGNDCASRLGL
jgi:hypothetical protein